MPLDKSQTLCANSFREIYSQKRPVFSLEFFPPKVPEKLEATKELIRALNHPSVTFMTVTYGAGGGSRTFTKELVSYIHHTLEKPAVAHLTCVGHSREEIDEVLEDLKKKGIQRILALRGDITSTMAGKKPESDFSCALDLIAHIAKRRDFSIACAGYPETHRDAASSEADIKYLKQKVDAGSEVIFTQLFFEADLFFRFRDAAVKAGITVPIVPGIMPISDVAQLERFTSLCGASIPDALHSKLLILKGDKKAVVNFGSDYASELSRTLISGGVPGIHLYTLNRADQVLSILSNCVD